VSRDAWRAISLFSRWRISPQREKRLIARQASIDTAERAAWENVLPGPLVTLEDLRRLATREEIEEGVIQLQRLAKDVEEDNKKASKSDTAAFVCVAHHGKALDSDVEPPKGFLIDLLVPTDRAEDMLLGLEEAFEERWLPKYGTRCARRMFMTHSIGSVIGFWINWLMKHLRLLKFFASGRG
jgi:hypothetical protein